MLTHSAAEIRLKMGTSNWTAYFKRQLTFVVCMLLCGLSIQAAGDDLITDQIIISKLVAGTLPQRISSDEKNLITNLKINGEINGTDLKFIREMAGQSADGYKTKGNLSVLDLSDAKIVSGGDYYYSQRGGILETYYTKDDEIGFCAFSNCSGLTRLFLPSTITSIGHFAFENCSGLTSMTLPPSLTSIGGKVFYGCSRLTSLTVPSTLTSVEKDAFLYISVSDFRYIIYGDLATYVQRGQPYYSLSNETNTIKYYYNGQELTDLRIPSSVTSIGNNAFAYCRDLKNMTLPSGVTSIGGHAFKCCSSLTSVTLPSSLTSIGYEAFEMCGFKTLILPSSLTEIGQGAFANCIRLKSLTLSPSLTSIGIRAFNGCANLRTLTIPSGLTSIDSLKKYDFEFQKSEPIFVAPSMESVYVGWQIPIPAGDFFKGCDISKCTLYVPLGTKQAYAETEVWRDYGEIKEYDVSGVDKVDNNSETMEVSRYSLDGQRLASPTKGINIVKYSDGSIKKEIVE